MTAFKTNGDFLRSLSNDELALVINHVCNCCVYEHPFCIDQDVHCCYGIKQWLNTPYEPLFGNPLPNVCQEMLKKARAGIIFKEDCDTNDKS